MDNQDRLSSFEDFLALYETYFNDVLDPMERDVRSALREWRSDGFWREYIDSAAAAPMPVLRVRTRIKRPESVIDKINRHPHTFPAGLSVESLHTMNDILGARVVVYFMSHLRLIDTELRASRQFEICPKHPPVAYLGQDHMSRFGPGGVDRKDKVSGYAAIHYQIRPRASHASLDERCCVELQVRTAAEDLWAEVEHLLGYKEGKDTAFGVKRQFQVIAAHLAAIDENFDSLAYELKRLQDQSRVLRPDDRLNAETLPAALQNLGIGCDQDEVNPLLRILFSRSVETVGELSARATMQHLTVIKDTFYEFMSRPATNFELVAVIAMMSGGEDEKEIAKLTRINIKYLEAWNALWQARKQRRRDSGPE